MGAVFTRPADLSDDVLADTLTDRWRFMPASCIISQSGSAVITGSSRHQGERIFATVDDLAAKLRTADDTTDAAFGRLDRAFTTALSLHAGAGLAFVVAPISSPDGRVLARLTDRYSW